jgi:tellurite resistance protein
MHEQELAIVRALVPVAWADGDFADKEKQMLEGLLEAYEATEAEKAEVRAYAMEKRGIDDINLQDLSASDRRVLLQCAVLLAFADGVLHPAESTFLGELATKLRIPAEEAKQVVAEAEVRAKKHLALLG